MCLCQHRLRALGPLLSLISAQFLTNLPGRGIESFVEFLLTLPGSGHVAKVLVGPILLTPEDVEMPGLVSKFWGDVWALRTVVNPTQCLYSQAQG